MGNFSKRSSGRRDSYKGGGRGSRSSGGRGYGDRDDKPMYDATCDSCGKSCEVPFRPTGSKPIYCDKCFRKQDGRDDFRESSDRSERQMFSAVCDNCGKDCEVPFKPSSDKPIYCSRCFEDVEDNGGRSRGRKDSGSRNDSDIKNQLKEINEKLDVILSALSEEE